MRFPALLLLIGIFLSLSVSAQERRGATGIWWVESRTAPWRVYSGSIPITTSFVCTRGHEVPKIGQTVVGIVNGVKVRHGCARCLVETWEITSWR